MTTPNRPRVETESSAWNWLLVDAPGGTGKTFLISLISATILSQNELHLLHQVLLEGGLTDHSALKCLLNMQTPTCKLSRNSPMTKVLQQSKLIVWHERTIAHKKSLETLDRTMQNLRKNQNRFGGALPPASRMAGDFWQT